MQGTKTIYSTLNQQIIMVGVFDFHFYKELTYCRLRPPWIITKITDLYTLAMFFWKEMVNCD